MTSSSISVLGFTHENDTCDTRKLSHLGVQLNPGVSPGLNSLSPYFSGLTRVGGGIALDTVKCPVESARHAALKKTYAQL